MSEFTVKGTKVQGQGYSYNLTSKIDAKKLCQTLNTYHATHIRQKQIEHKLDKTTKTIIQLQLTTGILTEELETLRSQLK